MADFRISGIFGMCLSSFRCISLVALTGALTAAFVGFIFYQLYLHPLAKYPGPLLGRITRLYDLYHAYVGDKHVLLYQLHQRYGTIVRFSPNTISINDPVALKAIYSHGANVQKGVFYKCFRVAPNAISTLLATDKTQHARKRRVMGAAFSDQALKGLEQYVLQHVQDLVDRIGVAVKRPGGEKQRWSKPLDMQKWCNWLVFDIMGDLVFGKSFHTLGEEPENREGIRLLGRAARRNYAVAALPELLYWNLERWIPPFRALYHDRNQYLAFGKRQVMARTRDKELGLAETGRRDIFSFLLNAKDPESGQGFPLPELWMEGNTLIVAGSDTSSTTLAATLFYLLRNPITLTRLEKEIRGTFFRAQDIHSGPQLQSCTWLRACIDEAMRMSPAVPGLLPREVLPGGLSIPALDLNLPAGVTVGTCIYSIHHHEDYIIDPFTYEPSRWLQDGHKQSREALHAVFNPFSLGNRACLGKPLVYMEISIAIARLAFEYDIRLAPDQHQSPTISKDIKHGKRHPNEYHTQDWFLSNNFGPFAEFRARDFEEIVDSAIADCD